MMSFLSREAIFKQAVGVGAIIAALCSLSSSALAEPTALANPTVLTEAIAAAAQVAPSFGERSANVSVAEDGAIAPQAVHLVIDLSDRRVRLYENDQAVASYPVAVGRSGWETPTGRFEVFQMVKDPSWRHPWNGSVVGPGPQNPLGQRWIGFWSNGKEVIGFHGTPNEDSVGQAVSHGCIRMFNDDVAELFGRVAVGTPVTVLP
jgi:L,D-transpeptidase ErfK/SrfK